MATAANVGIYIGHWTCKACNADSLSVVLQVHLGYSDGLNEIGLVHSQYCQTAIVSCNKGRERLLQ